MPHSETLARIDAGCRELAASTASVERVGALLVHRPQRGFPVAARPVAGARVDAEHVRVAVERQRALGLPVRCEWIDGLSPSTRSAARAAGLSVLDRPLLALGELPRVSPPADVEVSMIASAEPRFAQVRSAVDAGFDDRDALEPERSFAAVLDRARDGAMRVCGALDVVGAVGGGSSVGVDRSVVELTGIAVVPRARRRGIGGCRRPTTPWRRSTSVWASDGSGRRASPFRTPDDRRPARRPEEPGPTGWCAPRPGWPPRRGP